MTPLEKVLAETRRYEHALLDFSAREHNGAIELVIALERPPPRACTPTTRRSTPRDIEHPQFPWTFQRYLYDCMHDYLVEMFLRHAAEPGRSAMTPAGELLAAEIRARRARFRSAASWRWRSTIRSTATTAGRAIRSASRATSSRPSRSSRSSAF